MTEPDIDPVRRRWVAIAAGAGTVGGLAAAVPFVASFAPSERARAAGAPVEVDIAGLQPGQMMTVEWRGQPVWVVRRTEQQLASLPKVADQLADPKSERNPDELTPEYARNPHRSIKPEVFVAVGICTHLGCSPIERFQTGPQPSLPNDWPGGFLCPCHGSTFDIAGRVYKDKPAPDNLRVPPYQFLSDSRLLIGEDKA